MTLSKEPSKLRKVIWWLQDPWLPDDAGAHNSLRWNLALRFHDIAFRLWPEQYWCDCDDEACAKEVGAPLICTSSYVRDR